MKGFMRVFAKVVLSTCFVTCGISLTSPEIVAGDSPVQTAHDPAEVIAYQGNVLLTQFELDAAFSKLPDEERLLFIRDGGKVDQLIRALLRRKSIAADATRAGFDQEPVVAVRMKLEAEKELAEAWLQKVMQEVPAADYEALAREDYLVHPDQYRSPVTLDISHILIGTQGRTQDEARSLAVRLEKELAEDPSRFDGLIEKYSDDPAKAGNGGRYSKMQRGMMVKPFEDAAFALAEPGAISEPVRTDYGWHIIRLNGRAGNERLEWSEVREEAIALARRRHQANHRENYLRRVLAEPIEFPDGAVEVMARRHFGENLERVPGAGQ
jgi:peptidyl-prolyl cis-trans isomerase C